jgi:hypothetical protein
MLPSRQISRLVFLTLIAFVVSLSVLPAQSWVSSHGIETRYQPPRYLSGYGVSDLPDSGERLQAARNDALAALSRQIRIRITSSEDIRTVDDGRGTRSRYTNTIQTATDLQVTGARFEISEERGRIHALAWIELAELRQQFLAAGDDARTRLQTAMESFDRAVGQGDMESAERVLGHADGALSSLLDAATVIRALDALAGRASVGDGVRTEMSNPLELERALMERKERLSRIQPTDPQQAADLLARSMLALLRDAGSASPRQGPGAAGRGAQVMPLLYQDADFSSSFGTRIAGLVSASLARRMSSADTQLLDTVVIRGSYWPESDRVEIQLTARDIQSGRVVAAAHTTIPADSVDSTSLRPANADIALSGAQSLLNDQIVSGGLELEVWTDKGRNERALVFEDGDFIQFYFRVNQPAFLQLSYLLASGDTVLLEEQFYIGIDRVNRVVALPYRFQVVPPFGVERLIVTAHSTEPPPPDVIPRQISGQLYQTFRTPGDAVSRTRGLVREQNTEGGGTADQTRVGEASVSITTVAGSR